MMWQDLVFMVGSSLSIIFLAPTLRDSSARVPLGTSLPSMGIGFTYSMTFFTLGMTFSAAGAFAAGTMWSLIALFRSPQGISLALFGRENLALFVSDLQYWLARRRSNDSNANQYVSADPALAHGQGDGR
ncbi:hypothetical protein [Natrinema salifodinae]|uniref:Uncharacterized protein n=1 Tax=Natrinema salifodinae TaxID=1202768 RepID=A0A1I0QIM0_9EURY|nr:hypothetical protein [Natrinema salifodinae]SEW26960.1 hypothetical protein SAMN05216285_3631 [Natrinema salifodinae]